MIDYPSDGCCCCCCCCCCRSRKAITYVLMTTLSIVPAHHLVGSHNRVSGSNDCLEGGGVKVREAQRHISCPGGQWSRVHILLKHFLLSPTQELGWTTRLHIRSRHYWMAALIPDLRSFVMLCKEIFWEGNHEAGYYPGLVVPLVQLMESYFRAKSLIQAFFSSGSNLLMQNNRLKSYAVEIKDFWR